MNLRFMGASALAILIAAGPALAQRTPLFQDGTVAPGDLLKGVTNGRAGSVGDIGGDANGRGVNPFGITEPAGGGTGLCSYTAPTGGPHRSACIGHRADGKAVLEVFSTDMPATGFIVDLNGTEYPVPGNVTGLPAVADTTALSLLASSYAALVVRQDSTSGRGAPAVMYRPSDAACTLNSGAGDGGSQIPSSDGKCWLAVFIGPDIDVRVWDVDASNNQAAAAANLTKLNAARAYSLASGGKCLLIPEGTIWTSAVFEYTAGGGCIRGVDKYRSNIATTSASADIIRFNGAFFGGKVSNLRLLGQGFATVTAGAGVRIEGTAANVGVTDVLVEGTFDGLVADDAGVVRWDKVDVAHVKRSAFRSEGSGATDYGSQNVFLTNFTAYNYGNQPTGSCIDVKAVGELHAHTGACAGYHHGYSAVPSPGMNIYNNYVQNINFDVSYDNGIEIDTSPVSAGKVQGIYFDTVTSGLSVRDGAAINGAETKAITFTNFKSHRNLLNGITILGGNGIKIASSEILSNSVSTPGSHSINLAGGTNVNITDNRFGGWYNQGNGNVEYNIAVQSSFTGRATITGNNLCEFGTGALLNSSTSTDIIIGRDNQCLDIAASGFLSEYGGTATILNGQSSVTFNHHFPTTPGLVIVTGSDIAHRYAATSTSTQITISADSAVSGDKPVAWRGWLKP